VPLQATVVRSGHTVWTWARHDEARRGGEPGGLKFDQSLGEEAVGSLAIVATLRARKPRAAAAGEAEGCDLELGGVGNRGDHTAARAKRKLVAALDRRPI